MSIVNRQMAALFDLDGVIVDTEGLYTQFWAQQGELVHPEIPDFSSRLKGRTLKEILKDYFPQAHQAQELIRRLNEFESRMPFRYVPGVLAFVEELKAEKIKLAIVTSSDDQKMSHVYAAHPELKKLFDVIVTADLITHSKPDPECYLLAARKLGAEPANCFVFEDSMSGLEAGCRAGMTVVGLSTTYPKKQVASKAVVVIPDFCNFSYQRLLSLQEMQ